MYAGRLQAGAPQSTRATEGMKVGIALLQSLRVSTLFATR